MKWRTCMLHFSKYCSHEERDRVVWACKAQILPTTWTSHRSSWLHSAQPHPHQSGMWLTEKGSCNPEGNISRTPVSAECPMDPLRISAEARNLPGVFTLPFWDGREKSGGNAIFNHLRGTIRSKGSVSTSHPLVGTAALSTSIFSSLCPEWMDLRVRAGPCCCWDQA